MRVDKPTGMRTFVYDAEGRVMGEYGTSASDVKAEFIWALPSLAANDNSPFGGSDVIGGYTPLAVASPAGSGPGPIELFWVHGNHLGVPIVYTNASGTAVAPPGDYLLPGFPGQSRVMADLYYNRYRDYDPVTGRYIQADPIGLAGGANGYIYAGANPVNRVDPDGKFWWLAGAIIGGGANLAYQLYHNGGNWECVDWWDVADWALIGSGAGEIAGLAWKFGGRNLLFEIAKDTTGSIPGKVYSTEKQALVAMAKADKKVGIRPSDMQAYKDLNKGLSDPFPPNMVRGPEAHPKGAPISRNPHGHVGPIGHIPIKP